MGRYYFDFCQAGEVTVDTIGADFANVEIAYLEAYKAAQEMWGQLLARRQDPRHCHFDVRDDCGFALFRFPFGEVLDSCHDRAPATRSFAEEFRSAAANAERTRLVTDELRRELTETRETLRQARDLMAKK